jgi:hypothetical protein
MSNELKTDKFLGVYVSSLEKAKSWDMVDGFLVDSIIRDEFDKQPKPDSLQSTINGSVINQRTNLLTGNTAQ